MLPRSGDIVSAGGDLGFRSDSSALVIVHKRDIRYRVAEILELRPEKGVPLKPSETIEKFAIRLKAHGAKYMTADRYYSETVVEYLNEYDLIYSPAPSKPALPYMRMRALLRQNLIDLPNHPRLLAQMREVQGKPLAGGGMSIISPRSKAGGHGDILSACVLAIYSAAGGDETPPPPIPDGGAAWEAKQRDLRRKMAELASEDKPWWKKRAGR